MTHREIVDAANDRLREEGSTVFLRTDNLDDIDPGYEPAPTSSHATALARAERAESMLCALAFDEARQVIEVRHGEGCDPFNPDRGCVFCEATK